MTLAFNVWQETHGAHSSVTLDINVWQETHGVHSSVTLDINAWQKPHGAHIKSSKFVFHSTKELWKNNLKQWIYK